MSRDEGSGIVTGDGTAAPTEGPTAAGVRAVCDRLARAAPGLRARSWREIADVLGAVGERFLDPGDALRAEALDALPEEAGYSPAMAERVLDGMARDWTADRIHAMVAAEFEAPACLDGPCLVGGRRLLAVGPTLCLQIVAGSVPGVGVSALVRSLVLKAPTLLKPGLGDVSLPELYARGLSAIDPELAGALVVLYWPGEAAELRDEALAAAEVAVVYGGDTTVRAVRAAAPATTRVVAYHHRVGLAVIGRDALGAGLEAVARELSLAVATFDQRGCVCPHSVYVEGGLEEATRLADALGRALERLESELPSGPLASEEGAALQQLRGSAELVAATRGGSVRHGGGKPWTVIVEPEDEGVGPPTLARGVRVQPVDDPRDVAHRVASVGRHLQTVAHAGLGSRVEAVASALARVGASRIVPLARTSFPPPWWLHDGRGPLRELVRWAEVDPG